MFSPDWDFPIGHPGNYSDNRAHPFNVIVASLEAAGADILFAAGNCGRDCPDGRCRFGTARPICGANSHPSVLSVAGVDTRKRRVGYSSQGPGRLDPDKPDLSAYTHFRGSGVYSSDGGTSAACPVAAGVVAAVRKKYPSSVLSPAELRARVREIAVEQPAASPWARWRLPIRRRALIAVPAAAALVARLLERALHRVQGRHVAEEDSLRVSVAGNEFEHLAGRFNEAQRCAARAAASGPPHWRRLAR
jgi:subtilisin family serine protease